VIASDRLVLLDTNVLLLLARGKAAGEWILHRYGLYSRPEKPLVSVVSLGELWRIAHRHGWGAERQAQLQELGEVLVVVELEPEVFRKYGEIGAYLDRAGAPIPQNDVWIAATAAVKRAVLLTTDSDFDRLSPTYIEREYIAADTLPRS
jgi:tRNA(fMet)-specific endonuclease VapC